VSLHEDLKNQLH